MHITELKKNLKVLDRDTLEARFMELFAMYETMSIEMTKINNIIQPFWGRIREDRENYQTAPQYLLRPANGLKWCIVCKDYVELDDEHTITEYNDANSENMRRSKV